MIMKIYIFLLSIFIIGSVFSQSSESTVQNVKVEEKVLATDKLAQHITVRKSKDRNTAN